MSDPEIHEHAGRDFLERQLTSIRERLPEKYQGKFGPIFDMLKEDPVAGFFVHEGTHPKKQTEFIIETPEISDDSKRIAWENERYQFVSSNQAISLEGSNQVPRIDPYRYPNREELTAEVLRQSRPQIYLERQTMSSDQRGQILETHHSLVDIMSHPPSGFRNENIPALRHQVEQQKKRIEATITDQVRLSFQNVLFNDASHEVEGKTRAFLQFTHFADGRLEMATQVGEKDQRVRTPVPAEAVDYVLDFMTHLASVPRTE